MTPTKLSLLPLLPWLITLPMAQALTAHLGQPAGNDHRNDETRNLR